ncbi:16S rRNA (guanine(527)-N(7))-methyltransferase RsmG [Ruegeria sp. 2012CJ41-6]|uniref:Ribosomal RNA small subunit methyltransferase G n=1 Tax=Ruegeria spongiae TaxID=2942209 RepID=A0ABT0Q101_9RHOB|nr:16S rRNA (guanine(527)-N(7))-methyltransferase RsmG [Ruegeria spongiae]MCL6283490.1 16S rRNA (guanine(527)-N(7))-methyltransferase RsmG [Ruegeria spongiae]
MKDAARALSGFDVSRETIERLTIFAELVKKWNPRINLVSRNSLETLWDRHFVDSLQVLQCADLGNHWVDIGSGGGFPGLVTAIAAMDNHADHRFTLIESDQRKCAFLRTVVRETGCNVKVLTERIESVDPQQADILSARALTDLDVLFSFCDRHLKPNGLALFPKGVSWKKEVDNAAKQWNFTADAITSLTEPNAVILKIRGIARV